MYYYKQLFIVYYSIDNKKTTLLQIIGKSQADNWSIPSQLNTAHLYLQFQWHWQVNFSLQQNYLLADSSWL